MTNNGLIKYTLHEIALNAHKDALWFVGHFEDMPDPKLQWPHRHGFWSVVYFTRGSGGYIIDMTELAIKPGSLFIVGPEQVHDWEYSDDTEGFVILFAKELASNWCAGSTNVNGGFKTAFSVVFDAMMDLQDIQNGNVLIEAQHALDFLNDRIRRNGVVPIGNIEGLNPKQAELERRLTEAKRLLLFSDMNISEISWNVGYEDSSYFARVFRHKTGMSPIQFQRKYRNNKKKS